MLRVSSSGSLSRRVADFRRLDLMRLLSSSSSSVDDRRRAMRGRGWPVLLVCACVTPPARQRGIAPFGAHPVGTGRTCARRKTTPTWGAKHNHNKQPFHAKRVAATRNRCDDGRPCRMSSVGRGRSRAHALGELWRAPGSIPGAGGGSVHAMGALWPAPGSFPDAGGGQGACACWRWLAPGSIPDAAGLEELPSPPLSFGPISAASVAL